MSKKPQLSNYRLCIKSGTFDKQKPSFVVKSGKFQKKINTYFIHSDKQRYNYDLQIQKSPDTDIMIHCDVGQQLLGTCILKVDSRKPQQPNQTLSVMNSKKQKIATIDCSLKKLDKIVKKPAIIIEVIQASYLQQENKSLQDDSQSFIVLKYGDANYQTKCVQDTIDHAPVWKQSFHSAESEADRIFVQIWKKVDKQHNKFQGLALLDVSKVIGTQKDYEIQFDKKKKGTIKVAVYEDKGDTKPTDVKVNDKNFVRKRTIKAYILQTLLKDPSKKQTFIRLVSSVSQQKFQTSHKFQSSKQLGFTQAFNMVVDQNQQIQAFLIMNDSMQEQMGRGKIKVNDIQNKKYELKLLDGQEKQIGTLYLQFFDQQLDIKEQINQNLSQVSMPEPQEQSKASKISQKTASKLSQTAQQLKTRYANRQSIHDYMNEVNTVLQQGLLKIAKQRPQNPIKELGLYLINYKKS